MRSLEPQTRAVDSGGRTKRSVLVVHNAFTRFVQIDCELLAKHYRVTVRHEASPWRIRCVQIWNEVKKHDLVYCWFASWHSFVPVLVARLMGKPAVVVIGGYDVASVPQAGYGSQRRGLTRYLARAIMRLATHLLPFSNAANVEARANAGIPPSKLSVAYLGVARRSTTAQRNRDRMALTIGNVWRENLLRKGLLPFVKASHLLPDVRFVHAGAWKDHSIVELRNAAGPNMEFLGFVSDERLADLYDQASVYVQASLHEGFGMSVAEAMAAGCIPVTTRCGSLPELVGETGIYLSDATPDAIAKGIIAALDATYSARLKAQKRIQEMFSLGQRETKLRELLEGLFSRRSLSSAVSEVGTSVVDPDSIDESTICDANEGLQR